MKNSIKTVIDNQKKYFQSKNTFDISPGLKINSKTIFRPIS